MTLAKDQPLHSELQDDYEMIEGPVVLLSEGMSSKQDANLLHERKGELLLK